MNQRLMLYRKVAAARHDDEIDRVLDEAADRYGPLPDSVLNLADYGRIRVMADRLGIETIDREGRTVVLKFRPQAKVDPVRLVALVRRAARADAGAAGGAEAEPGWRLRLGAGVSGREAGRPPSPSPRPVATRRGRRTVARPPRQLVDGAGPRRRGEARLHQGRDPAAGQGRSAGAGRGVRARRRAC